MESIEQIDRKVSGLIEWLREDGEEPNDEGYYTAWALDVSSEEEAERLAESMSNQSTLSGHYMASKHEANGRLGIIYREPAEA